ncbi:PREDICTED: uncharacterized protein LOC109468239 isoform X2 [Branchiostoma belcheri]|uniref:Uncharacterized protein LOC109468239 isoform X2 n=1 Tax=Branchiostoma belcheri TaxID=7741 RepID=A0A6P4YTT4_BRABE|nr:PREDICTED: uncharacterized protein LOC109468239 isoform X2 [Branchiostoma belcheri]
MSTSQKHVTCLSRGQTTQEALLVFVQYFNKKATQSAMDVLLVNCDKTYSLESVEELIKVAKNACVGSNIRIEKQYCNVSQLQAVSEKVRQRRLLCGVLVVNAYESRLSINEEKAGIGYAVLYRALLEAAQGRVVVVIGGDDRYKAGEQDTSVLSTWAYHKIAAQFDDTYLDGRRGFVFSWDQRHNPVHEGALGSYLRAILSDKPGLEEPFKPSPPKVPPRPLPQLTTLPPSTPTDSEHNRLLVELAENTFDDDEARRIEEKLEKSTKQIQEEDQRRGIRFVVCCVDGKPLPEFGTFSGDFPPDLPKYMIPEILEQSANTQIAGVIVFDEGTDNTLSLRVFDLNENEGRGSAMNTLYNFAGRICGWFRKE